MADYYVVWRLVHMAPWSCPVEVYIWIFSWLQFTVPCWHSIMYSYSEKQNFMKVVWYPYWKLSSMVCTGICPINLILKTLNSNMKNSCMVWIPCSTVLLLHYVIQFLETYTVTSYVFDIIMTLTLNPRSSSLREVRIVLVRRFIRSHSWKATTT